MVITNQMLNERRETDCFAITPDRKYYHVGNTFIKRSLRPTEWQISPTKGTIHVPRQGKERILNEAAAMRYIADNTDIPVPQLHCCFEDDGAVYLIMEYIQGVSMNSLSDENRAIVEHELEAHIKTLHSLRSTTVGGTSGLVVPPHRVIRITPRDQWNLRSSEQQEYVFCHNDLSQQNILVNPESLKIAAILDWEYAGFYPEFFDRPFYKRLGPSIAIDKEVDDAKDLLHFLNSQLVW